MDEKKKMIVLVSIVAAVILLIVGGSIYENHKSEKLLSDFYDAFKSTDNKLIMAGSSSYAYNDSNKVILEQLSEEYGMNYFYIDVDSLNNTCAKKVYSKLGIEKESFNGIFIAVVKDDEIVDSLDGYTNDTELLEFAKKYNLVKADAKLVLNHIDYNGYKKVVKSDDAGILVLGQTTCGHCAKVKPILSKISKEKNIVVNYLDLTKLSQEEREKLSKYLPFLDEIDWGTPLTLIVKNGEVLDYVNGALDYDGYVKLFKKNDFIK